MIPHQSGRWGYIASSSRNNGCTCLPCHLCLLIVSLSYIGEVNMSPASDRRAFIWKISLLPAWLFFLLLFFFFFLSLYAFLSLSFCLYCLLSSRRGEEVVKVKWLCLDTDFTSWLGEVTARLKSSHPLVSLRRGAWQTSLISSSFGAINPRAKQSYLQPGVRGRRHRKNTDRFTRGGRQAPVNKLSPCKRFSNHAFDLPVITTSESRAIFVQLKCGSCKKQKKKKPSDNRLVFLIKRYSLQHCF